jgi:hypothetical protein
VQAEGREIKIGFIGPVTAHLGSFGWRSVAIRSRIQGVVARPCFKYDLVIVSNESQPSIGQQAKLKPLSL